MKPIQKLAIKEIARLGEMYQVGGSLLPHKTRDYDFLLFGSVSVKFILAYWADHYIDYAASEVICYEAYSQDDSGKKCIIKLKILGDWFDLLYVDDVWEASSIKEYMEYIFPISCQRTARRILSGEYTGKVNVDDITYWCDENSPYIEKYKAYYPDATFTKVDRVNNHNLFKEGDLTYE